MIWFNVIICFMMSAQHCGDIKISTYIWKFLFGAKNIKQFSELIYKLWILFDIFRTGALVFILVQQSHFFKFFRLANDSKDNILLWDPDSANEEAFNGVYSTQWSKQTAVEGESALLHEAPQEELAQQFYCCSQVYSWGASAGSEGEFNIADMLATINSLHHRWQQGLGPRNLLSQGRIHWGVVVCRTCPLAQQPAAQHGRGDYDIDIITVDDYLVQEPLYDLSMTLSPRISTTTLRWRSTSLTPASTAMTPGLSMWWNAVMPRMRWNMAMTPRLQWSATGSRIWWSTAAFHRISLHFSAFLCISLDFTGFHCISLHFSAFYIWNFRSIPSSYGRHLLF